MHFGKPAFLLGAMVLPFQSAAASMKSLSARSLAAAGLPDPMCKTGVISLKTSSRPQSCCAGYCGECNDYMTCSSKRGQDSKNACCATAVYEQRCGGSAPANVCLKQCSQAVPPCIMDKDEIVIKDPKRNAADDCTKVVADWRAKATSAMKQGGGTCKDPTTPTDIVQNGGFDGGNFAPWKCFNKPGDAVKNGCHLHNNYRGHAAAMHLHGNCHRGTQGGIQQTLLTTDGVLYKLKFSAFEGQWDGDDTDTVQVKIENSDKNNWEKIRIDSEQNNNGWKTVTLTFTANGPTTVFMWSDKNQCIDVDDVQLLTC